MPTIVHVSEDSVGEPPAPPSTMECPDEDTFALLLEGRLSEARRHEIESHLDRCAACSNLLVHVAKVFARPSATAPGVTSTLGDVDALRPRRSVDAVSMTRLSRLQLVAAVLHTVIAVKFVWLLSSTQGDVPQALFGDAWSDVAAGIGRLALSYWLAWAPLGAVLALLSTWALRKGSSWAVRVTTWYAVLSLPSVVFLPLSGYVLFELRRLRTR